MDLIARIICLDWANHPGEGGPWTIGGYTIPRDGGRPYLFGWEHEGGYSTAVWDATYTNRATGKRMTFREFMGRCHAGTLRWLRRPRTAHGEHATWADLKQLGRKIDRLGYRHPVGTPATKGIAELSPYYDPAPVPPPAPQPPEDDDMGNTLATYYGSTWGYVFNWQSRTAAGMSRTGVEQAAKGLGVPVVALPNADVKLILEAFGAPHLIDDVDVPPPTPPEPTPASPA
jgi:hypothetical protein